MIMAKVVGTVIINKLAEGTKTAHWLLVNRCDHSGNLQNEFHIARDMVKAGYDELVLICQGSSARQTKQTTDQPLDAIIVAIVDLIDEKDKITYKK